ncbi:MAG: hypothetical protein LBR69_03305 [Endomicrobium sp.]|jgi:beta-glucuronidase|nr:hypothetical protein [Endomicrobium sp.]
MNFSNLKYKIFAISFVFIFAAQFGFAAEVKVRKTSAGSWKMTVDGKDYFIKGLEYSADKVNSFPDINEWMWSDINENGKIDGPYDSWVDSDKDNFQSADENAVGDFALMKAMGCNTIRIYHSENVNKELLRDLYNTYGIMVIMGNYLGAYTKGSGASWHEGTDYNNPLQRHRMRESVREMVLEHKDEPYLLMWMLGNENDSRGMEVNSTKTNTNAVKYPEVYAGFLNDAAVMIKNIDGKHPVGVCNATVKFLDYYAKYSPDIDILGFNQYSGPYGFGVLWNRVKTECPKPVLITEYGCDSYNSNKNGEDERYQAQYHAAAWRDMENNSYRGEGAGNSIGGIAYCWLDKWWLIGSHKIHDTDLGAWKGPKNDNLFHDEWLGLCSQGDGKQSPFKRQLKEVYFTYQEDLWSKDITKKIKK